MLRGVRLMVFLAGVLGASVAMSGCAAYMAANQPGKKDMSVLSKGQSRSRLIAEFGPPIASEVKNGVKHDIFKFVQGYHTAAKVGRAVLHGAADVVTLGLWEVVGTPTEGYFNGTEVSLEVVYDANDTVVQIVPLRGADELPAGAAPAAPGDGSTGTVGGGTRGSAGDRGDPAKP